RNLLTSTIASRLGPAKPRGIGCDGAGASVIASQSRQENFSRTCSMTFQRRGSHSRVFDTTSPSLRSRLLPHLPHAQGAGSTIRSIGRLSGRGRRGGRGFCARFCLAASGAAISALVSCSAWVSSRSSMASSSCSTSSLPRSEDCPNCSRRALASISFSRSISSRPTVTSLFASVSCSRCATIIACAVARSAGSGSEGVVTMTNQPYSPQKIAPDFCYESKSHSLTGSLRTPCCLWHAPVNSGQQIGQLRNADRDNAVRHRWPQKAAALQPLREQTRAKAVMPNDLDQVAAAAPKNVEI